MNEAVEQLVDEYDEKYRRDHPEDHCPKCNRLSGKWGVLRVTVTHSDAVRAVDDATLCRCEAPGCGHVWINIYRPDPDDYPHSDLADLSHHQQRITEFTGGSR